MSEVTNPGRYTLTTFNANYALSGGLLFALHTSSNKYYVVSEFQYSNANSRRFPYQGKIEDTTYSFTETGATSTGVYQLYCASGISSSEGGDTPVPLTGLSVRDEVALQVLNAMIGLTPNPLSYKDSTKRLLIQKAFELSNEFALQASGGSAGGGGSVTPGTNNGYVSIASLDGLSNITKICWCTQYPENPEAGVVYIKLRVVGSDEEVDITNGGGA